MAKPGLPQGMRDFNAETLAKRNYILNTIRSVFLLYGFEQLETPAMENLQTLIGKYGEEGDKLIFKVLNNGLNDPKNREKAEAGFSKVLNGISSPELTERALKYDLTIPFARYVAMNHGSLTFPYKRFQMQPVWRADRPQKGRYREFIQCDADVVGSKSLLNEIDLANIYHDVFTRLSLKEYTLLINNRKILAGLANICGSPDLLTPLTVAIDKLDKIGAEKVFEELGSRNIPQQALKKVEEYLSIKGSNEEKLQQLSVMMANDNLAMEGISEASFVISACSGINIKFDPTLARGLNYYTGSIFEVKAPAQAKMGSIGGGGRYDDLTGLFGVPGLPGVGISFGVDRIYDVLEELQLFSDDLTNGPVVLFFNLGQEEIAYASDLVREVRQKGISSEIYHEPTKFDKQFRYAEKRRFRYVVIIGSNELSSKKAVIKELSTGHQDTVNFSDIANYFAAR